MKILFVGKEYDGNTTWAIKFLKKINPDTHVELGDWGDPLPDSVKEWKGDLIISFLSRWVLPEYVLDNAKLGAINFHPAPPEYPGIGCNNFALYDNVTSYGVTCHRMAKKVDNGHILKVVRFPIFPEDSIESLLDRTHIYLLTLYYDVVGRIIRDNVLPQESYEQWSGIRHSRKDLNDLATISPDMPIEEIDRRVRATSYHPWEPKLVLGKHTFELKVNNETKH